jgi:hypothetical protein
MGWRRGIVAGTVLLALSCSVPGCGGTISGGTIRRVSIFSTDMVLTSNVPGTGFRLREQKVDVAPEEGWDTVGAGTRIVVTVQNSMRYEVAAKPSGFAEKRVKLTEPVKMYEFHFLEADRIQAYPIAGGIAPPPSSPPPPPSLVSLPARLAGSVPMGLRSLYTKTWAVIIGIDRYALLPHDMQLRYAVNDAQGVEQVLRKKFRFDVVVTLYDEAATREGILKVLQGDLGRTGKDDAVFVFFAGHGYTELTGFGELGYLIPHDGSWKSNEMYRNISMTVIKEDISKAIHAKHVFFVVDACYGGLLLKRSISVQPTGGSEETITAVPDAEYLRSVHR